MGQTEKFTAQQVLQTRSETGRSRKEGWGELEIWGK